MIMILDHIELVAGLPQRETASHSTTDPPVVLQ